MRIRPLNDEERRLRAQEVARALGDSVVVLLGPNGDAEDVLRRNRTRERRYAFDQVFGPDSTQADVYAATCQHLLDGVLDGYNATVFAYGPTGAGKTFTMVGDDVQQGAMVRTLSDLFARIQAHADRPQFQLKMTYVELYNESLRDLLIDNSPDLDLRDHHGSAVVCGVRTVNISSAAEVWRCSLFLCFFPLLFLSQTKFMVPHPCCAFTSAGHVLAQGG